MVEVSDVDQEGDSLSSFKVRLISSNSSLWMLSASRDGEALTSFRPRLTLQRSKDLGHACPLPSKRLMLEALVPPERGPSSTRRSSADWIPRLSALRRPWKASCKSCGGSVQATCRLRHLASIALHLRTEDWNRLGTYGLCALKGRVGCGQRPATASLRFTKASKKRAAEVLSGGRQTLANRHI